MILGIEYFPIPISKIIELQWNLTPKKKKKTDQRVTDDAK